MRSDKSQKIRLYNLSVHEQPWLRYKLAVPVTCEPYFWKRTILASFTLPYRVESFRPVLGPLLDLVPQLLPSPALVRSFTVWITIIEAVVDDVRQIPCHLIGPGSLQS
jgi:hypothetical protein